MTLQRLVAPFKREQVFGILASCRADLGDNSVAKFKILSKWGKEYFLKLRSPRWEEILEKCLWDEVTLKGRWDVKGRVFIPSKVIVGGRRDMEIYNDSSENDVTKLRDIIREEGMIEPLEEVANA